MLHDSSFKRADAHDIDLAPVDVTVTLSGRRGGGKSTIGGLLIEALQGRALFVQTDDEIGIYRNAAENHPHKQQQIATIPHVRVIEDDREPDEADALDDRRIAMMLKLEMDIANYQHENRKLRAAHEDALGQVTLARREVDMVRADNAKLTEQVQYAVRSGSLVREEREKLAIQYADLLAENETMKANAEAAVRAHAELARIEALCARRSVFDGISATSDKVAEAIRTAMEGHEAGLQLNRLHEFFLGQIPGSKGIDNIVTHAIRHILDQRSVNAKLEEEVKALQAEVVARTPNEILADLPWKDAPEGPLTYARTGEGLKALEIALAQPMQQPQTFGRSPSEQKLHDRNEAIKAALRRPPMPRDEGLKPQVRPIEETLSAFDVMAQAMDPAGNAEAETLLTRYIAASDALGIERLKEVALDMARRNTTVTVKTAGDISEVTYTLGAPR